MKRIFVILAIVSLALALVLCGCRAATKVPGVTAIQSALGSLPPVVSPSPSASGMASASASGMASTSPAASASASAPSAS